MRWAWCGPRWIYLNPVSPPVNIETQLPSHRTSAVLASISLLLTAGLEAGQRARIFPFSGLASTKQYPSLPSLREVQEAGSIRINELSIEDNSIQFNPSKPIRDWLTLAARELLSVFPVYRLVFFLSNFIQLVDLKYITNTQIIELNYEGNRRRFTVHSILPKGSLHNKDIEIEDKLSHDISVLALDQPKQLWSVTWDSFVSIISDDRTHTETAPAPHKVGTPSIFLHVTQLMWSLVSHKSRCWPNALSRMLTHQSVASISRLRKFVICWRSH